MKSLLLRQTLCACALALGVVLAMGVTAPAAARDNQRNERVQQDKEHDKARAGKQQRHQAERRNDDRQDARRTQAARQQAARQQAEHRANAQRAQRQQARQRQAAQRQAGEQRNQRRQAEARRDDARRQQAQRQQARRQQTRRRDAGQRVTSERAERREQLQRRKQADRQRGDARERHASEQQARERQAQERQARAREQRARNARESARHRQEHRDDRTPRVVGGNLPRNHVDNDRRDDERRARQRIEHQQRLSREQQERSIRQARERAERYHRERRDWQRRAELRSHMLRQQHRMAKLHYQQQYHDRLHRQQIRWNARNYDYYRDPFYYTPARYRYSYLGSWHRTNRYGAALIRQAVDYGYREGLYAGRADRQDGWRNDYRNSYAYRDASYGYNGYYIPQGEYSHYFRQGFRRGYDDGYYGRYRYGHRDDDGNYAILAAVLAAVVGFQLLN